MNQLIQSDQSFFELLSSGNITKLKPEILWEVVKYVHQLLADIEICTDEFKELHSFFNGKCPEENDMRIVHNFHDTSELAVRVNYLRQKFIILQCLNSEETGNNVHNITDLALSENNELLLLKYKKTFYNAQGISYVFSGLQVMPAENINSLNQKQMYNIIYALAQLLNKMIGKKEKQLYYYHNKFDSVSDVLNLFEDKQ